MKRKLEKPKLDKTTRGLIVYYCKKYPKWHDELREKMAAVSDIAPMKHSETHSNDAGDPTSEAVLELERIKGSMKYRICDAVEQSRKYIGFDIDSEELKVRTQKAIWSSAIDATKNNYNTFDGFLPFERRSFFKRKNDFFRDICSRLDLF